MTNDERMAKINKDATAIRQRLCKAHGITEDGKPLESAVANRTVDGRVKVFGIPIGRER